MAVQPGCMHGDVHRLHRDGLGRGRVGRGVVGRRGGEAWWGGVVGLSVEALVAEEGRVEHLHARALEQHRTCGTRSY